MNDSPFYPLDDFLPEDVLYELKILHEDILNLREVIGARIDIDPKRRYSLKQAAEYLGLSKATIKRRIASRQLAALRDGGRRFVTGAELLRYSAKPRR